MNLDKVVWYIDWVHMIMFEVLLAVAATCSAINLAFTIARARRR